MEKANLTFPVLVTRMPTLYGGTSTYPICKELYRRLERTHKPWRTIRRLSNLSIEEVVFFIALDESRALIAGTAGEEILRNLA